ncbi:MAG: DUF2244 domain-containing protein [Proteobacteria bacterium]|nr:DUF2244 domain-containing protein [Pseudomonadota bacterium]MDA1356242.1 DUF2244 domain-containing protein [Pseudomonadota bacterium]
MTRNREHQPRPELQNRQSEVCGASVRSGEITAPVLFDAMFEPHRSLSRSGFFAVILFVGLITLGFGILFLAMGAWPVFGFLGLDLFLLWLAIKLNARARKIVERIRVTSEQVVVTRSGPRGDESWSFNPYWLNVAVSESATGKGELRLSSHGFSLSLGAFLLPAERQEISAALKKALADMGRIS